MIMHNGSYHPSKWLAVFLSVLVGSGFLWMGCGKKGPPRPPRRPLPPAVKDLSYSVHDNNVELSWTVPGAQDHTASPPAAVKVFRAKQSAEETNCEKCPIRFAVVGDIPIHMKRSDKSKPIRMRFTEILEPGFRYIYKVTVTDEYGTGSNDSNIIKFDH